MATDTIDDNGRRNFLKALLVWSVMSDVVTNVSWLMSLRQQQSIPVTLKQTLTTAKGLFGLEPFSTSIVLANSNPRVRDRLSMSPIPETARNIEELKNYFSNATIEASQSLTQFFNSSREYEITSHSGSYEQVEQLILANKNKHIVSFGSPTSNLLTRNIMFYNEMANPFEGHTYNEKYSEAIHMPVKFELRRDAILKSQNDQNRLYRCKGPDGKYGTDMAPNWGFINPKGDLILPNTDGEGHLLEDFIIISILPNYISSLNIEKDLPVVCIGGTHSKGTEAIKHLFEDNGILLDINRRLTDLKNPKFWQAVVRVFLKGDYETVDSLFLESVDPVTVDRGKLEKLV